MVKRGIEEYEAQRVDRVKYEKSKRHFVALLLEVILARQDYQ